MRRYGVSDGRVLITVGCVKCGVKFQRRISKEYIRPDGSQTCSSYCKSCQQPKRRKYLSRKSCDSDVIHREVMGNAVRELSAEEIAEVEARYSRSKPQIAGPEKKLWPFYRG